MSCLSDSSLPTRVRGSIPLLLLSFLFVPSFAAVTIDYRASTCNNASTYTDGSVYSSNLDTVLNYLIQNGSRSGFNNSWYGQSPNRVYGLLQCIGNVSAQDCSNCSLQAKSRLQVYCPNDMGGQVWMTYCYLRYDNSSFVYELDTSGVYLTNVNEVSNGAEAFQSVKLGLLSNLSKRASNPASEGFAIGSATYSASDTIYGLVQCWRDISTNDCDNCLTKAMQGVESCCSTNRGAQALFGSCTVRYEIYFFYEPAAPPSVPPPSSSPVGSPPPNSSQDTEEHYFPNVSKVSNGAETFKFVKLELLSNLSRKASNPASDGVAIGFARYSSSDTIYGRVQCWRVYNNECNICLSKAIQGLESCCSKNIGAKAQLINCTVRYENYLFYGPSGPPSVDPNSSPAADTPADGTLSKSRKKSSKTLPIILGTLGGVILVTVICLFARRRKLKSAAVTHQYHKERYANSVESALLSEENVFLFSLETLIEATQNFHPDNKIGEGGFGAVHRGRTKDGQDIAVKKLSATSSQGKKEFMNEVKLVANIQHRNLVKLLGCCIEGNERLLVYEYLPNKSLDNFLFDPEKRKHLDWEKRYNIIIGIARGLLYLHEDSQLRIIHRDVKANNILLDDKLDSKIADFGLARLFPQDKTHIQTRVAGTYGYMAPEYAMRGQLSVKADVYSFGVLLLEIVSGRKNFESHLSEEMQNLLEWAWRLYKRGDGLKLVDSMVGQKCPQEEVERCIQVGLLCVQAEASVRPAMSNVLTMISGNAVTLPNPANPVFVGSSLSPSVGSGFTSVNETSVSELKPR